MSSDFLIVFLSIIIFLLIIWLFILTYNLKKTKERQGFLVKEAENENLLDNINKYLSKTEEITNKVQELDEEKKKLNESLKGAIQNVSVVRFDAFEDIGGKLSFAVALLDELGNGLVVSCINGRQESRTYAKPVAEGESSFTLSDEEKEAIRKSMRSKKDIK
ncbi:MAG: DUF4446 family protein [Actinobacteria bacterium]|nr:DUF4446 family protein [Actinomycetota bacterium]